MVPRFVGRLGVADVVSAANAALGFLAVVAATVDPRLGARLVLLAAVADGLDGVLARRYGGTPSGEYLDSLADVSSFCVAPAAVVAVVAAERWPLADGSPMALVAVAVPALFVAMGVVRLAMYTAYDAKANHTEGVPTTLAASIISAAVLAGIDRPAVLVAATAVFCYLMVSTIEYPDLLARDALLMGVVHTLAVLFPRLQGGIHPYVRGAIFPYALLYLALAYLLLSPWLYWRETGVDRDATPDGA